MVPCKFTGEGALLRRLHAPSDGTPAKRSGGPPPRHPRTGPASPPGPSGDGRRGVVEGPSWTRAPPSGIAPRAGLTYGTERADTPSTRGPRGRDGAARS